MSFTFSYTFGNNSFDYPVDKNDVVEAICEILKRRISKSGDYELAKKILILLVDEELVDLNEIVDSYYEELKQYFSDDAEKEYDNAVYSMESDRLYGFYSWGYSYNGR